MFYDEIQGMSPVSAASLGGIYQTLAASGTTATNSAPIMVSMTVVTGADGTKGVVLPDGVAGDLCQIFNNSASTLKVWPVGTDAISVAGSGLGTGGSSFAQLAYKEVKYKYITAGTVNGQWLANVTA